MRDRVGHAMQTSFAMKLVTLTTRGTDVVTAALQLSRNFSRADLVERYGKNRLDRDGALPQHFAQGVSNEIQRLSSDCSRYHKERHELNLIACRGSGQYCLRDEARPKLIEAANKRPDLPLTLNTLVIPIAGDVVATSVPNHVIGEYAQKQIMTAMRARNYTIMEDSSRGRSYDFIFRASERYALPQIMECKGSTRASTDLSLTHNEITVMIRNSANYWLGVVCSIELTNGIAAGGAISITAPPILDNWHLTKTFGLRRKQESLVSSLFPELRI
jgi:hypothetical protein